MRLEVPPLWCIGRRRGARHLAALVAVAGCALSGAAGPAQATGEALSVPSGQPVEFLEMLWDRPGNGLVYRFRFVAPEIGQEGRGYEDVEVDMQHLCERFALPRVAETGPQPNQIVISLSQEAVEFGVMTTEVVQFFEAYRVEDETCILEFF